MDYGRQKSFYNQRYYANVDSSTLRVSRHLRRLATRIPVDQGTHLLDVGCGAGQWLRAARDAGARVAGIDISEKALRVAATLVPDAQLVCGPAGTLPWPDDSFDVVTCLGSLEHFPDQLDALREMRRVVREQGIVVILVPNADFLTRRLGLYKGTDQVNVREDVRTLDEWRSMFASTDLEVESRWRDLHVLTWSWIRSGPWHLWPVRAMQALTLLVWPLRWQYQVYHLCRIRGD